MGVRKERSAPIELLIRFIKECKIGDTFEFDCPKGFSENYLQRMRVELSRMRGKLRARKIPVKPFKMQTISVTVHATDVEKETVTIKKVMNIDVEVMKSMEHVLEDLRL
jgi:hypothetical protein